MNRLLSTLLAIVVSAIFVQASTAQTLSLPIVQADGVYASLKLEAQSLSMNFDTRAELPLSGYSIAASFGTSGFSLLLIEDEYIYRSMRTDEDGDFIDSPTTGLREGEKRAVVFPAQFRREELLTLHQMATATSVPILPAMMA